MIAVRADAAADRWLECLACAARFSVQPLFFGCPDCAGDPPVPIEMRYAPAAMDLSAPREAGIWAWPCHLPRIDAPVTLGEGSTTLLPIGKLANGPALFIKNETGNPSWSWKDRPNAVSVSLARQFGYGHVAAISTGNHGNALAALASVAGLAATVFCNEETPPLQIAMMQGYGARVIRGGDAQEMVRALVHGGGVFPATIFSTRAGFSNPFGVEGFKTIAFEIWRRLGRVPDRVFVGVGSGDGIYGIWKGFRELRECGATTAVPRMVGCQTHGADSLVRALAADAGTIAPVETKYTVASSLIERAVGNQALDAVRASGGEAVGVPDGAALESAAWLARRGIALEPSSAVPLAVARQSAALGEGKGETWVSIGSGAAPKWPDDLLRGFEMPASLPAYTARLPDELSG